VSTKKQTDTTNKYNPASMNAFNSLQPGIQAGLQEFSGDPLQQKGFNLQLQQGQNLINAVGLRNKSQLMSNMTAGGFTGGTPGFLQSSLGRVARSQSNQSGVNFINTYLGARQQQLQSIGMSMGYKPLQTGQSTTETTSGLGTWLPQVIGAGVSAAGAFATGGASLGMKAALGGAAKSIGGSLFSGALQSNSNASASNPFLYSQPGQGGYNPFYGYGGGN
jgi:hypothetical protein